MGKSIRSKRMRKNRNAKRENYGPKECDRLKAALAFQYNERTEKEHLSMFHDIMNGPPPAVPGLEKGSKLERAHLTECNVSAERIDKFMVKKMDKVVNVARRAITPGAQIQRPIYRRGKPIEPDEVTPPVKETDAMDDDSNKRVYDPKTMKDQYGNYPPWMNKRKVRTKSHAYQVQKAKDRRKAKKRGLRFVSKPKDVEMAENSESDGSDM